MEVLRIASLEIGHSGTARGAATPRTEVHKDNNQRANKESKKGGHLTVNGSRDLLETQRIHPEKQVIKVLCVETEYCARRKLKWMS